MSCFCIASGLGKVYWLTERYEEAEEAFNKEIRLGKNEKDRSMAYNELGNLYSHKESMKEAEAFCLKSLQADSTNINPYLNLGMLYSDIGQYLKSETFLKELIKFDSLHGAFMSLSYNYAKQNKTEDAIYYAKKEIQIKPNASNYYTFTCLLAILNKPTQALEALELAIQKGYTDFSWMHKIKTLSLCVNSLCGTF